MDQAVPVIPTSAMVYPGREAQNGLSQIFG
jgi:hypothetical protein